MIRFIPYAASGVLVAVIAWLLWQSASEKYQDKINALDLALRNCKAAALNIEEDKKSDAEIDNLDLDDFVVPDDWLRGPR